MLQFFVAVINTNGLKPARQKWRSLSGCVLPGGYNKQVKIMSLQKTLGSIHLTALG
jgi:hypothetical protein